MNGHVVEAQSKSVGTSRRAHHRVPLELPVALACGRSRMLDQVRDISEGGLGVATTAPLPPGTTVLVSLHLGRRSAYLQSARVSWSSGTSMGLRFVGLSPDLSDAIDHLRRALQVP